jgi:hypothetical protein
MIITNFNVKSVSVLPAEAYSPLVVYADTVLAFAFSFQLFEPVTRGNAQIVDPLSGIQYQELFKGPLAQSAG